MDALFIYLMIGLLSAAVSQDACTTDNFHSKFSNGCDPFNWDEADDCVPSDKTACFDALAADCRANGVTELADTFLNHVNDDTFQFVCDNYAGITKDFTCLFADRTNLGVIQNCTIKGAMEMQAKVQEAGGSSLVKVCLMFKVTYDCFKEAITLKLCDGDDHPYLTFLEKLWPDCVTKDSDIQTTTTAGVAIPTGLSSKYSVMLILMSAFVVVLQR